MAYVVPNDFRPDTLQAWTLGLPLTVSEAPDAVLTATIAAVALSVDQLCDDHFEPETGATVYINGRGLRTLYLPKRIRAVTSVAFRQLDATYVTQTATTYVVEGSALAAATEADVNVSGPDYLEATSSVSSALGGAWSGGVWPTGARAVRVIGDFSWPVVPSNIKRAVALLVWNWLKPTNDALRRADSMSTQEATYNLSAGLTGMPEADRLLRMYRRFSLSMA